MVEKKTSLYKPFCSIYREVLSATCPNFTIAKYNHQISYIHHHIKFWKSIMNRCSIKKLFLKILQYSYENTVLYFQSCNFIKKRFQHRCFPVNIAKFFRAPVLKNIWERLFKRFPTWIKKHNKQRMKWTFSQKKKKSKTQLDKKTYLFMMLLIISFFCIYPMHVRRRLLYIIKDDSSKGLQNSLTNEVLILDQWKNWVSYSLIFI